MTESHGPLKVQGTVTGFSAWAVRRFMAKERMSLAEATNQIVRSWLRWDREYLAEQYDISLDIFDKEAPEDASTENESQD